MSVIKSMADLKRRERMKAKKREEKEEKNIDDGKNRNLGYWWGMYN